MQMTFPVVVETGEDNETTLVNVTMEVELGEGFDAIKAKLRTFLSQAARQVMLYGEADNWQRRYDSLYYGVPLLSLMRYYDFTKSNDPTDKKIAAIAKSHGVLKIEEVQNIIRMANFDDGDSPIMEWNDWCFDCNNFDHFCVCEEDDGFDEEDDEDDFYYDDDDEHEDDGEE
jgi:hypothetical protein